MILYNVTINIENDSRHEWLAWTKTKHIPEMMATGCFIDYKILHMLNEEDNGGATYAIQFFLRSLDDLKDYENTYGAIEAEHQQRYKDRHVIFRTILEVLS